MSKTTETKPFHIGDVLSAMTGTLVSRDHIGGVYNVLNWMTGESLMTHQLPRASRECEGLLRKTFPDLAAIDLPDWSSVPNEDKERVIVHEWLAAQAAAHGETREVPRLPEQDHTQIDPIAELKMMRPDAPIVAVEL